MNVRIYKPHKTSMQSGLAKTSQWVLEYERTGKITPEPLMGWVSSEDTMNQVRLKFPTKEDAVAYAEHNGWAYLVGPAHERKVTPRNYGDNFRYISPEDS